MAASAAGALHFRLLGPLSPRGPALDGGLGHVTGAGVVARSPPPRGNQLSRPGGEGARSPTGGGDMSLEDPFFVVRGEVQKAVNTARGLYQRWCELLQEGAAVGREELDWTTNELRNGLRSIEWDLEDLEETIGIVEANPGKFKLPAGDLQERKVFVERMREAVQEMKDHMVSPAAVAFMERNNREMLMGKPTAQKPSSDLLDASVVSVTSRYIEEQQATQQLIMDQQDEQLEMVSGSIRVLKHMSSRVGEELDEQGIMLDTFAHEMDHTQSRMDGVLRKMAKVSHMTSDRRQWCAIVVLLGVLLLVLILLFSL